MTGELDAEMGPIAVELINEFGKQISYIRVSAGEYDPATSSVPVVETPEPIAAFVTDPTGWQIANGLGAVGGKNILVAALGWATPSLTDKFVIDGKTYTVMKDGIKAIYSGELVCAWTINGQFA